LEPLIRDRNGGAVELEFKKMTDEELRRCFWTFPEARKEYTKRFLEKQTVPRSG
jgi:hypothetical protein